jgi:integrase
MATITKRAKGQYQAKVRRTGFPTQTATFETKSEAEAWARQIEAQADKGIVIDTREASRTSLREALERYEREVTSVKRGKQPEKSRIKAWLASPLADRALISIRGGDMATYRDKRLQDGLSGNSVRLELAVISHLYKIARTEWRMEGLANPVQDIRKPKLARGRDRRLRDGEEKKLLDGASPILREAIILALETAMRRGELCSLTRDQIDRKRKVAKLDMTKNGDTREVPLTALALEAIDALPARIDGRLLGVTADWLSHAFEDLTAACKIKGLTLHDCRHEATSRLFEKGLNVMEVAAITGHKTLQVLKRYTHLKADDLVKKLG